MARWKPNAAGRLGQAAMELFERQGFAAMTVPEIAARAGLTTRSFFRYYSDKRDVLFSGLDLDAAVWPLIADAPSDRQPLTVVEEALHRLAKGRFDGERAAVARRRAVIASDASLTERDAMTRAQVVDVASAALRQRGIESVSARLLAAASVEIFWLALDAWLKTPEETTLSEVVDTFLPKLRAILVDPVQERTS